MRGSGSDLAWATLRIAYGTFFALIGAYGAVALATGGGNPFQIPPGLGADFQAAMQETGFLVPLMLAVFVAGGIALIVRRTAPLGIVLLPAPVTVIFCYHLMPGGQAWWGVLWLVALPLLAWRFRKQLSALVDKR